MKFFKLENQFLLRGGKNLNLPKNKFLYKMKKLKNVYIFFIICIFYSNNVLSQKTIELDNTCRDESSIIDTFKNRTGVLVLGKPNLIFLGSSKNQSKIIPCNAPPIKSKNKSIKILFSGGIKEGHSAMKAMGATILLTHLVIFDE